MNSSSSYAARRAFCPSLLASAMLAALPCAAWAQAGLPEVTVSAEEDKGYAPASTRTATKGSAPLRDVPQSVNIVTEQLMQDQGATSMQDALSNVPGVSFNHGDGQRDQVQIRGFSAITDWFVDGVRDDALYFRDLSDTERVEVLKGPAAVLYGRGSSGGIINRVTKSRSSAPPSAAKSAWALAPTATSAPPPISTLRSARPWPFG